MSIGNAQDDTANLEYTRAIMQDIQHAKPRRRSNFQRRERQDAPITVFEDVMEDQELVIAESRKEIGGTTLLGKAARKMPRSNIGRLQEMAVEEEPAHESRRRVSSLADSIPGLRFKMAEPVKEVPQETKPQGGLKKDPRRRTIFVPSDDTTVLTIHPGANTTDRLNDTFQLPSLVQPPSTMRNAVPLQEKQSPKPAARRPRMSLAVAPKRLPLQQMAAEKGNLVASDVAGQSGGKENLPPGSQTAGGEKKPVSRLFAPTAASQARGVVQSRKAAEPPSFLKRSRQMGTSTYHPARSGSTGTSQSVPPSGSEQRTMTATIQQKPRALIQPSKTLVANSGVTEARSKLARPPFQPRFEAKESPKDRFKCSPPVQRLSTGAKSIKLQQYAVLSGDLAQPDLYEDDWLRHQEVALTEVINQLFDRFLLKPDAWHATDMPLRERLVEIYHQPHVSTLHQRLQASLLYGSLSLPSDACPIRVSQDIGLRKRFLNLWLDSYNEEVLRIAAEVVVGRQIPGSRNSDALGAAESDLDTHRGRRNLIAFLETFFVDVQDLPSLDDLEAARWRKMIARSLMLTWLLDQAKTTHAIDGCLFKTRSLHKNSTQVLQMLNAVALPSSIGDITRALRHCDYAVVHEQYPLDEVTYHIENLASDMRDGTFLCRLVEMLMHPKTHGTLSQHLKMPCLGRAQRLFNIDIALSALNEHSLLRDAAIQLTADDIVNGHREKTLSLLWSLVSTYGLEALVDFRELTAEIRRYDSETEIPQDQYLAQHQQEALLQSWATVICAKETIPIDNLTSSFADGRAYAAIVEAYAPFRVIETRVFSSSSTARSLSRPRDSCASHLRALGCSTAFITSLTRTTHTLPSRQTTISNLAFLASRLLPLKRRHNAAVTIQRALRLKRSRIVASQRVALMRMAHACATVVQTQQRLVDAAMVLQRAWRAVLEARIGRLNADVEDFQALARGWVVRKKASASRRGTSDRVLGGW